MEVFRDFSWHEVDHRTVERDTRFAFLQTDESRKIEFPLHVYTPRAGPERRLNLDRPALTLEECDEIIPAVGKWPGSLDADEKQPQLN